MSHRSLAALAVSALLVLAGCSSSGGSASAGASVCTENATAGTVAVSIIDFAFQPAAITAKVGDTVTFTNTGAAPHTATLDGGQCTTPTIQPAKADGLTFTAAGTYKFHCTIHTQMTGTIVVS